ncbi:Dyp-type peroxidase [Kribbella sp. VKM Ac-2568]|uniref:Dyp-type peroxidase n=1 Tax=Kribbella sp. VKM Ac-2568 TaxID=2512219 RepID=UPI00104C4E46|nr:Dyp-type peroxidase [Kribbella sp. VKM Ac-2568]TCM37270.1 Dyp-type peroxidase family [Kribbella sp. VKM Ac-2568]
MNSDAAIALAALAETQTALLSGVELPASSGDAAARLGRAAAETVGAEAVAAESGEVTGDQMPAGSGRTPQALADEPVYDADAAADIQGNIVPGFNKDHQHFLFLRFGSIDGAREWVGWLAPRITAMDEVLDFRREFRALRLRLGVREPGLSATWTAVAFSFPAIAALAGHTDARAFGEQSFRQGLAERSTYLGDPTDPDHRGHRANWVVGGPDNEADALVIVAADDPNDLDAMVDEILDHASAHGITLLFGQRGDTLPGNLQGHEHFGFKDGISQPGVRGRRATSPDDHLTPRFLDADDPHAELFAKPGQPLVWPGQFLLGELRQHHQDPTIPAAPASAFPDWARRGSYLVCRRLHQDVVGFWEMATAAAAAMGTTPVRLASMLVGRWPSGAPLMRSPDADDAALAGDEFANNHFLFDDETRPSALVDLPGYPGDTHRPATEDLLGKVCPFAAHIRKVNSRDSGTDFGAPADTFLRLMLRRGIPYGEPIAGIADPSPELETGERGLLFAAYMASIEDQFEFVTRRWANSPVQPNVGGVDPIIGQRDVRGDRRRTVDLPAADGSTTTIELQEDLVTPTGGGYFFAPPISALRGTLAAG